MRQRDNTRRIMKRHIDRGAFYIALLLLVVAYEIRLALGASQGVVPSLGGGRIYEKTN